MFLELIPFMQRMTVTITAKHDILQSDDNDNETCSIDKYKDHSETLMKEYSVNSCLIKRENKKHQEKITDQHQTSSSSSNSRCNKNNEEAEVQDDLYYEKAKKLLNYEDAPSYLKHNCFILSGYRGILNTQLCLESIFWWTNETINIWSHIFGFLLFFFITIRDVIAVQMTAQFGDKFIVGAVLICFQVCMFCSALYHTFSCRSEKDCDIFLSYDLFGIALSLLAIYTSGIYYAFWCDPPLQNFYLVTITVIFGIAMVIQIPRFQVPSHVKTLVFVAWAAYGVLPTLHWTIYMGGFENPVVALLFPRVIGMYIISGIAFLIYATKIPERFYSGKFDYLGHSHQWWHLFVLMALYYWHNSGIIYLEYRFNHACSSHMTIL